MSENVTGAGGERRRRREAERAAREAAERPLTRRELRAREQALQTGAIQIDATGEVRVIKDDTPQAATSDAVELPEVTDTSGLTRRQLRELRARQEAAQAADVPTPARGVPAEEPATVVRPEPQPEPAAPPKPAAQPEPKPTAEPVSRPIPPVRRPVVRPAATTGAIRSLAEDGTGLTPVVRAAADEPGDDPASTGSLTAAEVGTGVDVTDVALPPVAAPDAAQAPADPGPLPTSRRSRRAASELAAASEHVQEETPSPSLDELIAGEAAEAEEPFEARPSWAQLPPPTPPAPLAAVPEPQPTSEPEVEEAAPTPSVRAHDDEDIDEDDEDDHGTPVWLTALMVLVLVVIGIVLGLLVWKLVSGDDGAAGAVIAGLVGPKGWLT